MKGNVIPFGVSSLVAIGLAVALAFLWAPPDRLTFWLFIIVSSLLGMIAVLFVYTKDKWTTRLSVRVPAWLIVTSAAIGVLAIFPYLSLHNLCVVKATRPQFADHPPVYFPIWLEGNVAEAVVEKGSRLAVVNSYGPMTITKQLPNMTGYTQKKYATDAIFVTVNGIAYLGLICAFGLLAARTERYFPPILRRSRKEDGGAEINRRYKVALSFPGEYRPLVEAIAMELVRLFPGGQDDIFYDNFHTAQLARLNLDTYLQRIYHDNSELIVVFLCGDYERKQWPGVEWRAIRDLIKQRKESGIMPIRLDDGDVSGLFSIDGFLEAEGRTPQEIAQLIQQRYETNARLHPATPDEFA